MAAGVFNQSNYIQRASGVGYIDARAARGRYNHSGNVLIAT